MTSFDRQAGACRKITASMPDSVAKQRVQSFIRRVKASNAAKGKSSAGGGGSEATPVEDLAEEGFEAD